MDEDEINELRQTVFLPQHQKVRLEVWNKAFKEYNYKQESQRDCLSMKKDVSYGIVLSWLLKKNK